MRLWRKISGRSEEKRTTIIKCESCRFKNAFDQPYAYHAGFGDQGFLYNEKGNRTLIWSTYDPAFQRLFPERAGYTLTESQQRELEEMLKDDGEGGLWLFSNPARCLRCGHPISKPMMKNIYFLIYEGSLRLDSFTKGPGLEVLFK